MAVVKCFEINLGDVRQRARVIVNGNDCGTLITPPFRLVVDNKKPTGNTINISYNSFRAAQRPLNSGVTSLTRA